MARGPGPAHLRPGRPPRGSDQPPPPPAPQARPGLTELVKVRLDAVVARHGAHQPRLQERAPLVDQAAVAAVVILGAGGRAGLGRTRAPVPSPRPCPALPEEEGCQNRPAGGAAYQADAPDAGVHGGALRRLGRALAEEEVQLVVVALRAVGDELGVDERGVCGARGSAGSPPPARSRSTPTPPQHRAGNPHNIPDLPARGRGPHR